MQPMIAILTPFKCTVAALIRAVVVCRLNKVRPQLRAGDVIGLENARAGRLQNVVTQTQRLPGRFFALDQNRVADSIAKQRADVGGGDEQRMKKFECECE